MKKAILIFLLLIVLAVAGISYYSYSKVTYVPDWFGEQNTSEIQELTAQSDRIARQVFRSVRSQRSTKVDEKQVSSLILYSLKKGIKKDPSTIVKGIKTSIHGDQLSVEAVVNLKEIPLRSLTPQARKAVQGVMESIPEKLLEQVFVKVQGKPEVKNGKVGFDRSVQIMLGGFALPMDQIIDQMQSGSNQKDFLALGRSPFSDVTLGEGNLMLKK